MGRLCFLLNCNNVLPISLGFALIIEPNPTYNGFGNFSSLEIYTVENGKFHLNKKNYFPHSLGLFYQTITQFLGFKDYGDEYKVMALGIKVV